MKYIRTKDGRIINVSDNWQAHFSKNGDEYTLESYTANWNVLMGVLAEDIIAESDAIEELCDVFVLYSEDTERAKMFFRYLDENQAIHWFDPVFENIVHMNENIKLKDSSVYGAIWTDKGLIYVAKMNKEGELCLI